MMKPQLICAKLAVKKSSVSGYGVFAQEPIASGEIIEESYALRVGNQEPALANYYFGSEENSNLYILSLGYGSIYNHADNPNAAFLVDTQNSTITFSATRHIAQGEEIFISYGPNWFSARGIKHKKQSLWYRLRRMRMLGMTIRFALVIACVYFATEILGHLQLSMAQFF